MKCRNLFTRCCVYDLDCSASAKVQQRKKTIESGALWTTMNSSGSDQQLPKVNFEPRAETIDFMSINMNIQPFQYNAH